MKTLLLSVAAATSFLAAPLPAGERMIGVSVGDMTCPSCSYTVATSMKRVPTVRIVSFEESDTFGEGVFTVSFDDEAASPEMIIEAVMANGYPARLVQDGSS